GAAGKLDICADGGVIGMDFLFLEVNERQFSSAGLFRRDVWQEVAEEHDVAAEDVDTEFAAILRSWSAHSLRAPITSKVDFLDQWGFYNDETGQEATWADYAVLQRMVALKALERAAG